jgi:hypothetical protein
MPKKRDGELSKQNIRPHSGLTRDADQVMVDERTSDLPMDDTQEHLDDNQIRVTLRAPNGFKPEIICSPEIRSRIANILARSGWEIIRAEPESLSREIEQALQPAGEEQNWVKMHFRSGAEDLSFKADPRTEEELTQLFEKAGCKRIR